MINKERKNKKVKKNQHLTETLDLKKVEIEYRSEPSNFLSPEHKSFIERIRLGE